MIDVIERCQSKCSVHAIALEHAAVGERLKLVPAPDRDTAEAFAFRTERARLGPAAHHTRGAIDVFADSRVDLADLGNFFDGRLKNLPLGVVAKPLDPLPVVGHEGAAFVEADTMTVGEQVKRSFDWGAGINQLVLGVPERVYGLVVDRERFRIAGDSPWGDDIRIAEQVRLAELDVMPTYPDDADSGHLRRR